jgi:hypothetical protein
VNGLRTNNMKNFIFGTVFGIVIATIGFSGVARLLDSGVNKVKTIAHEQANQ